MKKTIEMKYELMNKLHEMIGESNFIFEGNIYKGIDNRMIYGLEYEIVRKATEEEIELYNLLHNK